MKTLQSLIQAQAPVQFHRPAGKLSARPVVRRSLRKAAAGRGRGKLTGKVSDPLFEAFREELGI